MSPFCPDGVEGARCSWERQARIHLAGLGEWILVTFTVSDVPTLGEALPSESLDSSLRRRTNAPVEAGACNAANLVGDQYRKRGGERLLRSGFHPKQGGDALHALVAAAHFAFDQHYPLVLSPDDIWLGDQPGLNR